MNAAHRIVRVICVFNGVCAVVCGGFMMAGAAGILPPAFGELFGFFDLMVPLIQRMPLPAYMTADLFWPGLALALVNGVANLVAAVLFAPIAARVRGRCWPARCSSSGACSSSCTCRIRSR